MIDLAAFRQHPDVFRTAWSDRGAAVDVDGLLALDGEVRRLKTLAESLRAEVNAASKLGEDIANAGEIIGTQAVVDQAEGINLTWQKLSQPPQGMGDAYKLAA